MMVSSSRRLVVVVSTCLAGCVSQPADPCPGTYVCGPGVWYPGTTGTSYTVSGAVSMVRPDGSKLDWTSSADQGVASTGLTSTNDLYVFLEMPVAPELGAVDPSPTWNPVALLRVPTTTPVAPGDWAMILCPHASDALPTDLSGSASATCAVSYGVTEAALQVPLTGAVQTPQPPSLLDVSVTTPAGSAATVNVQVSGEAVTTAGTCVAPRNCL